MRSPSASATTYRHPSSPAQLGPGATRFLSWLNSLMLSDGLVIKSTRGIFEFGAGLSEDELAYLSLQIKRWIRTNVR
ncbi:hypothetical protein GF356_08945 [candidate division GN15 bacterium]|nr:hypothetical protein [candidate division GN15 bacterium]